MVSGCVNIADVIMESDDYRVRALTYRPVVTERSVLYVSNRAHFAYDEDKGNISTRTVGIWDTRGFGGD